MIITVGNYSHKIHKAPIKLGDYYVVPKPNGGYCEPIEARFSNKPEWNGPFKDRLFQVIGSNNLKLCM
jgi:hypothetical protein